MNIVAIIFLVAALVLFIIAAIGIPSPPRFNLVAAGLACLVASQLVGTRL